jgi:hypothetical protein
MSRFQSVPATLTHPEPIGTRSSPLPLSLTMQTEPPTYLRSSSAISPILIHVRAARGCDVEKVSVHSRNAPHGHRETCSRIKYVDGRQRLFRYWVPQPKEGTNRPAPDSDCVPGTRTGPRQSRQSGSTGFALNLRGMSQPTGVGLVPSNAGTDMVAVPERPSFRACR